jgi:hypothetical protein
MNLPLSKPLTNHEHLENETLITVAALIAQATQKNLCR